MRPILAAVLVLAACSETTVEQPSPVPAVFSANPAVVAAGSTPLTLTIIGEDFVAQSRIRIDGGDRPTTFIGATSLSTVLTAADLDATDTLRITVFTGPPGGGLSGEVTVTVGAGAPSITSLDPGFWVAGGPAFQLRVRGTRFVPGSVVRWNGLNRPTFFESDTILVATIAAADVAAVGTASVTVHTGEPGGGTSAPVTFPVAASFAAVTPVALGGRPWHAAISSTGTAYVTRVLDNAVQRIDVAGNSAAGSFTTGSWPYEVLFNAAGTVAYASHAVDNNLAVIDVATHSLDTTWAFTGQPIRLALSSGGGTLYVTNTAGQVHFLSTADGSTVAPPVAVGGVLNGLARTPDGTRLWTGNTSGLLREINTATHQAARSISMGGVPQEMVITPDGTRLYVANEQGWLGVYRLSDLVRLDSISMTVPFAMAMNPAGTQLWVSRSGAGLVTIVNPATNAVVGHIPTGGVPRRIAFTAAGVALIANENGLAQIARP